MKIIKQQIAEMEVNGIKVQVTLTYDPPVLTSHQLPLVSFQVGERNLLAMTEEIVDEIDTHEEKFIPSPV